MGIRFKLAIVEAGKRHQEVAGEANVLLARDQRLSELDITRFVTDRKCPSARQAEALARVLGKRVEDLFPGEAT